jgi:putative ABC transport system ATP-binding protein
MAGLENVTGGTIALADHDITNMAEDALAALRRDKVGIVFQAFRLIASMTALQNVSIPLELAGDPDATARASAALESVGLGHRLHHLPDQMSGGEQQRVAIARAIAPNPTILLADEPTGNLDSTTGEKVIKTLFDSAANAGAALVLVTHDANLAARCSRVIHIEDGKLAADSKQKASG